MAGQPFFMRTLLLMMLAGALGAGARYGLTLWIQNGPGALLNFPLGTLVVNVAGCLLLSVITTLCLARTAPDIKLILGTGFCGAFTTFSTFELEAEELLGRAPKAAVLYVGGNLVLGFGAIFLGRWLAFQILERLSA